MSAFSEGIRIYNLFPLIAGTMEEWQGHLDRIAAMGFNYVFVNPFHATGESGSLYAVKDYYRLNRVFKGKSRSTDDNLIMRFVKAAEDRGLTVMMDLVLNHTAYDSPLTEEHPDWYVREADGTIAHPYAVDPDSHEKTVWYDLAELDFTDRPARAGIVDFFTAVVRHYVGLGIRAFRCDAAYKVPSPVWQAVIGAVRRDGGDALFMAESLGAMLEQVEQLRDAGFDYLMNSSKWWDFKSDWLLEQYELFRVFAPSVSFPETHDTARLAADLTADGVTDVTLMERAYKQAYVFAAAFSTGLMIPVGFEYGFRKRLHVVETTPASWEEPAFDLTGFIAAVNKMKARLPVLNEEGPQRHVRLGDRAAALVRRTADGADWAVSLINIDRRQRTTVRLVGIDGDIAGGREMTPGRDGAALPVGSELALEPGEVRLFASDAS